MLRPTNEICKYHFKTVVNHSKGDILTIVYGILTGVILISNLLLIVGVSNERRNKKRFSRNDKLVLLLSFIDLLIALVQLPLQMMLIKFSESINCMHISVRAFWNVFPMSFSGSLILLISSDRLLAVYYNNKLCGVLFKELYLIPCVTFLLLVSAGLGTWYAFAATSPSAYKQSIFFYSLGSYIIVVLMAVTIINISLLIGTKKHLRNYDIQLRRSTHIEKRLTWTIMIVSITLVISYFPSALASYHLASVMIKNPSGIPYATTILLWTLVFCQLNSGLNALIYITRNRRVSKMYIVRFNVFLDSLRNREMSVNVT